MSHSRFILVTIAAAVAAIPGQAAGQQALEIIGLRHRTVEQVLPALRPLLEPGATLSGHGNQLIVRTSSSNLAELKAALAAFDRPLRRLQISVRFDEATNASRRGLEAGGRIGNHGTRIDVRAYDAQSVVAQRVDQRIQVLEGGRARILTGQSTPIAHEAALIREAATGFEVVPRLSGDTVLLDIAPQKETLERQQYIATTVSVRLGEWLEIGGADSSAARDARGIASTRGSRAIEARSVWLKVEELP